MAWTAPRTWVAAETVDEDHMNEQVKDNMLYLKTEADKHDDCVMRDGTTVAYASPTGARAKSTVYQNTGGKIRMVSIVASGAADSDAVECLVGVANPPTVVVGGILFETGTRAKSLSFMVPPSYYYKVNESNATITISYWVEWDIL